MKRTIQNHNILVKFEKIMKPVTKFLSREGGDAVSRYLETNDITVTKFLNEVVPAYLEENGIDMGWYLDTTVTKFLEDNDISVTKFLG